MPVQQIRQLEEIPAKGLVLLDLYASWCGPCRKIAPVIEELSDDYGGRVTFLKADVDLAPSLAAAFKVNAMPTFVFIRDGAQCGMIIGANVTQIQSRLKMLTAS